MSALNAANCEVAFDNRTRQLYATDASPYQLVPGAVAFPKNTKQAAAIIQAPRTPLVANIAAGPVHDPDQIRRLLVEQVTGRVRWRESMLWMAGEGGVTRFAEVGAGKVLSGMAKRIAPDAEATPLNTPADLEAFAASL